MIKKVLIANRGEIALRILRACKELGIPAVVVHSDIDSDSLPVRLADESVCIGPAHSKKSYLNIPAIISAAEITGADAIHPGYGFLAENEEFATICNENGLEFIGPKPDNIRLMGDKAEARRIAKQVGVPVIPGSDGPIEDLETAKKVIEKVGYPFLIKAVYGGGGRGMRIVNDYDEMENEFYMAKSEAISAFGNGALYIEKYIEKPHHIEIQVLADKYGNAVHLGERDCSIQRRHQKLIEETPSCVVTPELRERMGASALALVKSVGYVGAGTIEFLLDKYGNYYFMEMNTRIQVEHPITEMVTGIDLVKQQILIANDEKLSFKQEDIKFTGHSIECRITAEDPNKNFMPVPGKIETLHFPGGIGVRIDSHIYQGYSIPPYYDSLIAKLIVHATDRTEAINRTKRALEEFIIEGVPTTIDFYKQILSNKDFIEGNFHTQFLENYLYSKIT